MKLYNSLTRKIEPFIPRQEGMVTMYTCGPTVYHYAHIGNLRTYIFEDVLEKVLVYLGYKVKRVMNITDVGHMTSDADEGEDKMLLATKREQRSVLEIADFYTEAFFKDCAKLKISKPEIVEKATDHIDEYIKIIAKLLEDGYAYLANANVYFDISKMDNYYQLSGKKEADLLVAAREDVTEDLYKRNPFDFGLWFTKSKFENQELQWDSPWGRGYPGWHIECTALAIKYLGDYLDLHCGGIDHLFPHHTNEIAQAEAYLGHKWCTYFVHGEFLNDQTGKMSKSKGSFLTLSVLEEKGYLPLSYRFLCLQSHYRNQLNFTYQALKTASNAYLKLKNKIKNIKDDQEPLNEDKKKIYQERFREALRDDLNTANALTCLFDLLKDNEVNNHTKLYLINDFDQVLSLDLLKEKKSLTLKEIKKVEELIKERKIAKEEKNYLLADQIRDNLKKKGILIKDTKDKTIWEVIS